MPHYASYALFTRRSFEPGVWLCLFGPCDGVETIVDLMVVSVKHTRCCTVPGLAIPCSASPAAIHFHINQKADGADRFWRFRPSGMLYANRIGCNALNRNV